MNAPTINTYPPRFSFNPRVRSAAMAPPGGPPGGSPSRPAGTPSDHSLLLAWWEHGAQPAARLLYRRHYNTIYRFFNNKAGDPSDVHDLVNETFLRLFRRRAQPPTFRVCESGEPQVRPFLFGIAKFVLFAHIRQKARERVTNLDEHHILDETLTAIYPHSMSSVVHGCRELYVLTLALRALPLRDQILIEQKYFGDLSEKELADLLGIPTSTVPGRIRSARTRLVARVSEMFAAYGVDKAVDPALPLESLLAAFRDEMMKGAAYPAP